MLARVRWSASRVCLEAVELPLGTAELRAGYAAEATLVARFSSPPAAAEITVALGAERRHPLSCALAP
jgi:hypothetical protein